LKTVVYGERNVVHRERHFWVRLLIGTGFAVLILDVIVLAILVVPLRAAQQAPSNSRDLVALSPQAAEDQLLMLPTHDPSKPWPTRTPIPTATPWLAAALKLAMQRQAELAAVRNAAQTPASLAEVMRTQGPSGTSIPTVSSLTADTASAGTVGPTVTPNVGDIPIGTLNPTVEVSFSVESSGTITPTTAEPAETPGALASVPSPTLPAATPELSQGPALSDEEQFTAYVQDHYNTIADQPLDITAVTLAHPETGLPLVTVEVSGGTTNSVFAAQTADAVADYGRRLLADTKSYFSDQSCEVSVVSKYETSDPDGCTSNPSWCYLRVYDEASQAWSVVWTYVVGTFDGGSDSVQTWNAAP
jgi:hypothetical protein